jgi:hypothetical protein
VNSARSIGVSVLRPGIIRTNTMDPRRNLPEGFAGTTAAPRLDEARREWVKQLAERVSRGNARRGGRNSSMCQR